MQIQFWAVFCIKVLENATELHNSQVFFHDRHQAKIQLPHPFDIIVKKFYDVKKPPRILRRFRGPGNGVGDCSSKSREILSQFEQCD